MVPGCHFYPPKPILQTGDHGISAYNFQLHLNSLEARAHSEVSWKQEPPWAASLWMFAMIQLS